MLSWIREKFGTVIIGAIIAFIAFVFVFYGVFSPKATRGLHEGAVAGTVNGDPISIADYRRELNRQTEYIKQLTGGKVTDEQLKMFRVKDRVFQDLAQQKLKLQEARHQNLVASDEEVRKKIQEIPAFQKDGKFDLAAYKQVLENNSYTPSSFERLVRDDLTAQQWEGYFLDRVHVSEGEVKREFLTREDKREIKYVLLTFDAAKKGVAVSPEEIKKYLADPAKLNVAKAKYESGKSSLYKGQKFDEVKETLVRSILAGEKLDEVQKVNDQLAAEILPLLSEDGTHPVVKAHPSSKKGLKPGVDPGAGKDTKEEETAHTDTPIDKKIDALLKPYDTKVKTTGLISRQSSYIPGIGEAKDLIADAFNAKSPLDPKLGGKAKKYSLAGRVLVAVVVESQKPDLAKLPSQRSNLMAQLMSKKARDLYQEWMQKAISKAKIDPNPSVVNAGEEGG